MKTQQVQSDEFHSRFCHCEYHSTTILGSGSIGQIGLSVENFPEDNKIQAATNDLLKSELRTFQNENEKQRRYSCITGTLKLKDEERIEKMVLDTYPDMLRYDSDEWALPMRCFHKDVDYNSVFGDSLKIAEKSEKMNDISIGSFSNFQHSPSIYRSRSLYFPNQVTFMETDVSSIDEDGAYVKVIIDEPTDFDVLCGRGGRANHHKGNIYWLQEKSRLQNKYLAALKEEKQSISRELIERIQQIGGRFLEPIIKNDGSVGYHEVTDRKRLLKKAGQTLREKNDPLHYQSKRERYGKRRKADTTTR